MPGGAILLGQEGFAGLHDCLAALVPGAPAFLPKLSSLLHPAMGLFDQLFGKKKPPEKVTPVSQVDVPSQKMPEGRVGELPAQFPFPVSSVPGGRAEEELLRLRRSLAPSGSTPVILGGFDDASRLFDLWDESYDLAAELGRAEALDVEKWVAKRKEEDAEAYEDEMLTRIYPEGTATMHRLTVGYDYKGKVLPEVFIATLPTADSTLIPLHLRFGDWNACPSPHVHTAMARYWKEKYGAEIATMTADVVEFTVSSPPTDHVQATELAWQQFLYCGDIVSQGVGSVATLAEALKGSTRWYFWWD
jgi:hypothetical protein